jgi:hypothetical protein
MTNRSAIARIRAIGRFLPARLGLTSTAPARRSPTPVDRRASESTPKEAVSREHRLENSAIRSPQFGPAGRSESMSGGRHATAAHEEAPTRS